MSPFRDGIHSLVGVSFSLEDNLGAPLLCALLLPHKSCNYKSTHDVVGGKYNRSLGNTLWGRETSQKEHWK